ncbi:MAG: AMP-binding protein [Pseudomonadota bacterium]
MSFTIVDRLREHARSRPHASAFRFLSDSTLAPQELSYAQLWDEAGAVAHFLAGVAEPGSRIMLFFPPGLSYLKAFYGCLLAGMVAVPLYPPRRNVKSDRIINVAQSCHAVIALTTESELAGVQAAWDEQNTQGLPLQFHASDRLAPLAGAELALPPSDPGAPAFLQYTSGSTGTPKGVIVTHANIVANCNHLTSMSPTGDEGVFVNWVPAFHDLGLVTAVLVPVLLGAPSVLMAPASFVRDPALWLKAISQYRGNRCGAPNFAFELCVDKISDADLAGVDLSCWEVAYNAAEPVRAATLARFAARFAPWGFKAQAFFPSYGMAEATLAITGGGMHALPVVLNVDKHALGEMRVEPVEPDHPAAISIVGCGSAPAPHTVRVVDPNSGAAAPDGTVGEIWFSGPSVSPGYWGLDELSLATFGNSIAGEGDDARRYLRTGDLGVQVDGDMFIVGRMKDLIILRGRNYYPQDIEATAASAHHAVRAGCVAAFSVEEGGSERLVLVAELEREHFRNVDTEAVAAAIRQGVARAHDVAVERVVLLRPYKIPMTSSGKIQRRQTRAMLADGTLETLAQSNQSDARPTLAPRNATEQALVAIWSQVLGPSPVGVDENYFEIGGDSLAAVEIASQVGRAFPQLVIDPAQMLDYPTVEALARWLDLALAHEAGKAASLEPLTTIAI